VAVAAFPEMKLEDCVRRDFDGPAGGVLYTLGAVVYRGEWRTLTASSGSRDLHVSVIGLRLFH